MPSVLDISDISLSQVKKLSQEVERLVASHQKLCNEISEVKLGQNEMLSTLVEVHSAVCSGCLNDHKNDFSRQVSLERGTKSPSLQDQILSISLNDPLGLPQLDSGSGCRCEKDGSPILDNTEMTHRQASPDSNDLYASPFLSKQTVDAMVERNFGGLLHVLHPSRTRFWNYVEMGHSPRLVSFCESATFSTVITLAIVANACFMAVEENMTMSAILAHGNVSQNNLDVGAMKRTNLFFSIIFIFELCVKLMAYRCSFFHGSEWRWNVFDMILVGTIVNEMIQDILGQQATNLSFLRVLRALKVVKMLRLIQVLRFFRELRLIANSIVDSMRSMLWTVLLICMVTFVFGLAFLQAWSSFLAINDPIHPDLKIEITERWVDTSRAMLTLYMAATGGIDWAIVAEPIWHLGRIYYSLLLLYVSFFTFVVTNVVTSLFLDKGRLTARKDKDTIVEENLIKKEHHVNSVKRIFQGMEKDINGNVSAEEFKKHMSDKAMLAFCAEVGVEPSDMEQFFLALSSYGKQNVDLDTFVIGCIKIRGEARSVDMREAMVFLAKARQERMKLKTFCEKNFLEIHQKLNTLQKSGRSEARPTLLSL